MSYGAGASPRTVHALAFAGAWSIVLGSGCGGATSSATDERVRSDVHDAGHGADADDAPRGGGDDASCRPCDSHDAGSTCDHCDGGASSPPAYAKLYPEAPNDDAFTSRVEADGVIVTQGAQRLKRRHELSCENFNNFHQRYWEHRGFRYRLDDLTRVTDPEVLRAHCCRSGAGAPLETCIEAKACVVVTVETDLGADTSSPFSNQRVPSFRYRKVHGFETDFTEGPSMHPWTGSAFVELTSATSEQLANARRWGVVIDTYKPSSPTDTPLALVAGERLEFELTFKLAITDPVPDNDNYYSDTFKYTTGHAGLHAITWDATTDDALRQDELLGPSFSLTEPNVPSPRGHSAGGLTVPKLAGTGSVSDNVLAPSTLDCANVGTGRREKELSFMQAATNLQAEHLETWLQGRRLFHTSFVDGSHSDHLGTGPSGAVQNAPYPEMAGLIGTNDHSLAARCADCHLANGVGGQNASTMVVLLPSGHTFGSHLQPQEAQITSLTQQSFTAHGSALARPDLAFSSEDVGTPASVRMAPRIVAMGVLEALDEDDIAARADPFDADADGISGELSLVTHDGAQHVGRFGWRASQADLRDQIAAALLHDMGVRTAELPRGDGTDAVGAELDAERLDELVTYVRLLGVVAQRARNPELHPGLAAFRTAGCADCHVSEAWTTSANHPFVELRAQTVFVYTDLLLHDLGPALSDLDGTRAWRTPSLLGIGLVDTVAEGFDAAAHALDVGAQRYLHDGRARSIEEAILWHGGEAATSVACYAGEHTCPTNRRLDAEARAALLSFVRSL